MPVLNDLQLLNINRCLVGIFGELIQNFNQGLYVIFVLVDQVCDIFLFKTLSRP